MAIGRSHLFSQIVGSVGGVTYFFNRYAAIVLRNRVVPVDPATAAQVTVRTRMSAAMSAWQSMTQVERDAWENFSNHTPWKNSLGQDCRLTSVSMYLSMRLAALQIDPTLPSTNFDLPPCIPGLFQQFQIVIIPCTSGVLEIGFKLSVTNTHPTDTIKVGVQISTAQNTSINFWKGPYDPAGYQVLGPILPTFGVTRDYIRLTLGKRYFLRFSALNVTSGNLVSSPWHCDADAAYCIS